MRQPDDTLVSTPTDRSSVGDIALALGAGGARGIAHVVVLEVLDELGLRPAVIAGSSMGAIIGAAYATGMSGSDLRAHLFKTLRRRQHVLARLMEARVGRFADLLRRGLTNPVMVDAELMLGTFWPSDMPETFDELKIPLLVVATDFFAHEEVVLSSGPLRSAVAGSMAVPGLIRPVSRDGRVLVDGGAVNPLPFDLLFGRGATVVACDVVGGPISVANGMPSPFEAMFGSAQIMQGAITAKMLRAQAPDVLIRPAIDSFRALDFFRFSQILDAAETLKDSLKRDLDRALNPSGPDSAEH